MLTISKPRGYHHGSQRVGQVTRIIVKISIENYSSIPQRGGATQIQAPRKR